MADVTRVTVEITAPDGSYETGSEMIEEIKKRNRRDGYEISFVLKDCFRVSRGKSDGDSIIQFNNQHAVGKNVIFNN